MNRNQNLLPLLLHLSPLLAPGSGVCGTVCAAPVGVYDEWEVGGCRGLRGGLLPHVSEWQTLCAWASLFV